MTTIQIYPNFYKPTGKLNIKNIMKTDKVLNDYIEQYKTDKIHALILDNTFVTNKKIKLKGYHKKYSYYTIYSKKKEIASKIYKYLNKITKGETNKGNEPYCNQIMLYRLMGIKNYKRRLKYIYIYQTFQYQEFLKINTQIIKKYLI